MKRAIIQKYGNQNSSYGDGVNYWSASCDSAAKGFRGLGYEITPFDSQNPNWCALAGVCKSTPVRGSVQSVRAALRYLGAPEPKNVDIPRALKKYAGRKIWTSTVGEVFEKQESVFIKPLLDQKAFYGHVAYDGWSAYLDGLPQSYKLLCAERTQFLSEFRCYVIHGKIVKYVCYCYEDRGQARLSEAEKELTLAMLKDYTDQPAGFCFDVGRIPTGKSGFSLDTKLVLVEVNEGFSCGNYGLKNTVFAELIRARWRELVR